MKYLLLLLPAICCGCSSYTQVQMQLVEQARRGVELSRQTLVVKGELSERLQTLQRERLDEAFDADVREAGDLSPEWIIEHRRAYAAGLEALTTQHAASAEADGIANRNLEATDLALQRLEWLLSIQLDWMFWKKEAR